MAFKKINFKIKLIRSWFLRTCFSLTLWSCVVIPFLCMLRNNLAVRAGSFGKKNASFWFLPSVSLVIFWIYISLSLLLSSTAPSPQGPRIFLFPSSPTLSCDSPHLKKSCLLLSGSALNPLHSSHVSPVVLRKSVSFTEELLLAASGRINLLWPFKQTFKRMLLLFDTGAFNTQPSITLCFCSVSLWKLLATWLFISSLASAPKAQNSFRASYRIWNVCSSCYRTSSFSLAKFPLVI